jgi:hypothetical protein
MKVRGTATTVCAVPHIVLYDLSAPFVALHARSPSLSLRHFLAQAWLPALCARRRATVGARAARSGGNPIAAIYQGDLTLRATLQMDVGQTSTTTRICTFASRINQSRCYFAIAWWRAPSRRAICLSYTNVSKRFVTPTIRRPCVSFVVDTQIPGTVSARHFATTNEMPMTMRTISIDVDDGVDGVMKNKWNYTQLYEELSYRRAPESAGYARTSVPHPVLDEKFVYRSHVRTAMFGPASIHVLAIQRFQPANLFCILQARETAFQ